MDSPDLQFKKIMNRYRIMDSPDLQFKKIINRYHIMDSPDLQFKKIINSSDVQFNDLKIFNKYQHTNKVILNKLFLFIQIPKTSSTTVLRACQQKNLTTLMPCYRHEGLLYLENYIDSQLPVYAVVRNPYTQIFSLFFHKIRYKDITIDNSITLKEQFNNFVIKEVNNNHLRQYDYIKSNKNVKVNIIKFEDNNIIDVLNAKFNLNLPNNKRHNDNEDQIYIESRPHIKEFFSDFEIVNLIKRERKIEFTLFGYSTDINDI